MSHVAASAAHKHRRSSARSLLIRHQDRLFGSFLAAVLVLLILDIVITRGANEAGSQIVVGLATGGIYALIAIGYTMVYGIIELINFAHGDVFTLSAYYAAIAGNLLGLDAAANGGGLGVVIALIVLFPLTMLLAGVTGMAIERVAYRPLRNAPRLAPLITAIGVSFLLEGIMLAYFPPAKGCPGGVPRGVGALGANYSTCSGNWISGNAFQLGQVVVGWRDVFVVVIALGLMFLLATLIRRTRLGKAMRATAQDRDAALLCGININRTISATFFVGSALAAAAGIIYSLYYGSIQWNLGYRFGIIAFTAAVLGGIGNIVGAGTGGFLIGLIAVIASDLLNGAWSDAVVFAVLISVLTLRPTGLFGSRVADRA